MLFNQIRQSTDKKFSIRFIKYLHEKPRENNVNRRKQKNRIVK